MEYELNYLKIPFEVLEVAGKTQVTFVVRNCPMVTAFLIGVRYGIVRRRYKVNSSING
jgi:hypothetical protein